MKKLTVTITLPDDEYRIFQAYARDLRQQTADEHRRLFGRDYVNTRDAPLEVAVRHLVLAVVKQRRQP